jgi:hypothetical protein
MKKSTLVAVAVFAVLAVAFALTRERTVSVGVRRLSLEPVAADALTKVELGGAEPLVLEKRDGAWTVASKAAPDVRYPADDALVSGLLSALAKVESDDFVSERPEKHAEYEVDDAKGLSLEASTASGVVRKLVLGKTSKQGGVYVREAGRNDVFVVTGALGYQARRDLSGWRKKAIATAKADEVTKLTVTPPSEPPFTIALEEGTWRLESPAPKGFRFDAAAAQRLVNTLTSLSAQRFSAAGDADATQGPGTTTLALTKKDGQVVTVRVGPRQSDGVYPVRVEGDAQGYLVGAWQAESLTKGLEGLRDTRLLPFEPAKAQRLSIASGGKPVVVAKEGESWKLVEPKTAPSGVDIDLAQVPMVLQRLANLRALRVAADVSEAKAGVARGAVVEVTLEGGEKATLRFGAEAGSASEVYARGSDGLVYVVNAAERTHWTQGLELFKRLPPPPPMGSGLDQLPPDIRRQLEAQLRH